MEQQIHITLSFNLATGKVTLNEIVYHLEKLKNTLMLRILKNILTSYDDLIAQRLSPQPGVITPSKMRKGLGRHVRKGDLQKGLSPAATGHCHGVRQTQIAHPGGPMPDMRGAIFPIVGCLEANALFS